MKKLSFLLFILLSLTIYAQNDESFFIKLMETEFEAFKEKDPSVWSKYVDENALFTGADNIVKSKNEIIEEIKNAPDIFSSAAEKYDDVITRTFGNTAVLSCSATFSFVSDDGQSNSIKFKFTRVHIFDGKNWKLIYHSAIPI